MASNMRIHSSSVSTAFKKKRSCNEISKSLWFRGCLKACFFLIGPPKGEQDPAAVTAIEML